MDSDQPLSLRLGAGRHRTSPDVSPVNRVIKAKLFQISEDNRRLTEMVTDLLANYAALGGGRRGSGLDSPTERKRGDLENPASSKRFRAGDPISSTVSRQIHVRTDPADSGLVVRDGFRWRKYGQKVTRDNPFPRAYFKCSFAPSCPVKKKVQRSAEDRSVLAATYHGEHNHEPPLLEADELPSTVCSIPSDNSSDIATMRSRGLVLEEHGVDRVSRVMESPRFLTLLAERMASSLADDPDFISAIADAVFGDHAASSGFDRQCS